MASAEDEEVGVVSDELIPVLVDSIGRLLYMYTKGYEHLCVKTLKELTTCIIFMC